MTDQFSYDKFRNGSERQIPDRRANIENQRRQLEGHRNNENLKAPKPRAWFDTSDSDGRGKAITQRIIEFLRTLQEQYGLTPRDVVFSLELTCMNLFNMEDFPLSREELTKARNDAREYYKANRNKAPPPPGQKLGPPRNR